MFSSNTSQTSGGYEIQRSLRFNSADSAYLSRTPGSASNRKTWTWSGWVKRSQLSVIQHLFSGSAGNPTGNTDYGTAIRFDSNNNLQIFDYTNDTFNFNLVTTQVFRDVSAWYHIVVAMDDPQATASNRLKVYVNGSQITAFNTATYPAQNTDYGVNSTNLHALGALIGEGGSGSTQYLNGYMTEVHFIDGQALTPSSFGAFDAQTGVWGPTPYAGSYGTNGFYLNFSDNSNTTAATLGKDYSGNGNNWTPNNFSVSAGAGNDSLVDVPTNWGTDTGVGGEVRGNYSTLNPLQNGMTNAPTNGNLQIAGSADIYRSIFNTIGVSSGKWYFEVVITSGSGVTNVAWSSSTSIYQYAGEASTSYGYELENGNKIVGGGVTAYGSALTTNDVFMCAVDMDNLKLFFGKNGTWFASSDPVTGASPAYTFAAGTYFFQMRPYTGSSSVVTTNFGQRPFAYTAPSGFKALNTQNLPTPTIGATTATQAGKFFNPVLWTANGGVQTITGAGLQPDFLWIKDRQAANSHTLHNIVVGSTKYLESNTTSAEITSANYVTSIDSDGWSIGSSNYLNGRQLVSWCWKANGAGVTNTDGSITSTVSANTTSGFSIATFTSQASGTATVGHGLGAAPKMVIVKGRNVAYEWYTYHESLGASAYVSLSNTAASAASTTLWNATSPTSSVFSLGTAWTGGHTFVAYCFAEVPGYSKFGSYTGNGSADGPFVFCGFRPAYVLIKQSSSSNDWGVFDVKRNTFNSANNVLYPNLSNAEGVFSAGGGIDILSNGFKARNATPSLVNTTGETYIFMAFAEAPQKFALAR